MVLLWGTILPGVCISHGRHPVPVRLLPGGVAGAVFPGEPCDMDGALQHRFKQYHRLVPVQDLCEGQRREEARKPGPGGGLSAFQDELLPDRPVLRPDGEPGPCLMALRVPDFKSAPDNDCTDLIDRITAMDEEQFAQMQRMSAVTLTTDSLRFAEIVNWGLASDRKTYAKLFCDFSNTDLRECIKNIVVPSLVLLEPYFKHIDTVIKNQYKNLSVAQIRYADKGLHFVMFDDREWFIHQICEFIKER